MITERLFILFSVSLPENFGQLRKLEVLSLNANSLTHLPQSFSNLVNLKSLTVSGNLLTAFPAELLSLQKLDSVDLSRNKISDLPPDMSTLPVEVNLSHNQVRFSLFFSTSALKIGF